MKAYYYFFLSFLLINQINAQSFTPITEGHLVTTASASRSCNFVDVNNDSWDDIFISNGPSAGQNNMLYINQQDGTFELVTDDPIVQDNGKSDGVTFADVDNDGDLDAFVVTWYGQKNFFYRNNGNGTFSYESEPGSLGTYSETAAWGDYDNDGWVDLYLTNSEGTSKRNLLYHNLQDGSFERITTGALVLDSKAARSADWIDYDGDGDIDLYVTNENNTANHLFQNSNGVYTKITDNAIVQDTRSSAGSSWADFDNDGDFDLFVANWQNQNNQLFINQGDGVFTTVTTGDVVSDQGCSFGSSFADYDNDGDLDLFVCNAFCTGENNFFYENVEGVFQKISNEAPVTDTGWTFGCAWGDMDNDGYLDLALANCKDDNQTNALYHNENTGYNWFKINCIGTTSNTSAIGTVVRIKATIDEKSIWQTRHITAQSGYCSQNSLAVHFGLKNATNIDSLIINWTSGQRDIYTHLAVNQFCSIREGQGFYCVLTTSTTSVEAKSNFFKIYPNPSKDSLVQLTFFSERSQHFKINILDINGKIIKPYHHKIEGQGELQIEMDLKDLPAGVYMVEVRGKYVQYSERLVINN